MATGSEMEVAPDTPVLVGWAAVEQKEMDHHKAVDAATLMIRATKAALPAAAGAQIMGQIDWIGVPDGTTHYLDPGRLVGEGIGVPNAHTVLAKVGVMQQTLISKACALVSHDLAKVALVCGGEAKYRDARATREGETASVTFQGVGTTPDEMLAPTEDLGLPVERAAGLGAVVGFYGILESAWRAAHAETVEENRDALGRLYARFSEIASKNPHATRTAVREPSDLTNPSESNPMLAFPYTKQMVTTWTVDQASALVFCTAATAAAAGVPRDRWIFPLVSVESNHMVPVTARQRLTQPAAMRAMARASEAATGVKMSDIGLLDLYSCFPVAVKLAAEGLGIPDGRDLTVTGGMSFAGGPLNNYVLQACCRAADLLIAGDGDTALVSCVSGRYTKQGFTIWSAVAPKLPFTVVDVTQEVAAAEPRLEVTSVDFTAKGKIVGCTVLFSNGTPERAVAVLQLSDGTRTMARSTDAAVMKTFMTEEAVGMDATVDNGIFTL